MVSINSLAPTLDWSIGSTASVSRRRSCSSIINTSVARRGVLSCIHYDTSRRRAGEDRIRIRMAPVWIFVPQLASFLSPFLKARSLMLESIISSKYAFGGKRRSHLDGFVRLASFLPIICTTFGCVTKDRIEIIKVIFNICIICRGLGFGFQYL